MAAYSRLDAMELDPASDVALYKQIAQELQARIDRGDIRKKVPSIIDLRDQYSVRRGDSVAPVAAETASRALNYLASDEGGKTIKSDGTRGYFVSRDRYPERYDGSPSDD